MDVSTLEAFRIHLSEEYLSLVATMDRNRLAAEEIKGENTEDECGLASISHDKYLLYNLRESDSRRAKFIQQALQAIDSGHYGECSQCGEAIHEKRLQAIPWATVCVQCQEQMEQENVPAALALIGLQDDTEGE